MGGETPTSSTKSSGTVPCQIYKAVMGGEYSLTEGLHTAYILYTMSTITLGGQNGCFGTVTDDFILSNSNAPNKTHTAW